MTVKRVKFSWVAFLTAVLIACSQEQTEEKTGIGKKTSTPYTFQEPRQNAGSAVVNSGQKDFVETRPTHRIPELDQPRHGRGRNR
jgi:hypothetical protein